MGEVSSLFNGMNNYLPFYLRLHAPILGEIQVPDYYKFFRAYELNSGEASVNLENLFFPLFPMDKT